MKWTLLVIALFSAPGEPPDAYSVVLVPGVKCDAVVAEEFVQHITNGAGGNFAYSCDNATEPKDLAPAAPAPAKKKVPSKDEV
jgi:hypothetical protein